MGKAQRVIRLILFSAWAVLMTAVTYILGAPALKFLRRRLGRGIYWAVMTAIAATMFALSAKLLAISFFSLVILMGVFEEFEDMAFSFRASTFFTVLINALISAGGFALWVSRMGPAWKQTLLSEIEALTKPIAEMGPHLRISATDLMIQLPSIVFIMWLIAIYVGVLLESRMTTGEAATEETATQVTMRSQLSSFRLPDAGVWIFIAAILGAFGNFKIPAVEALAVNTMNVCMVLFFFQGIAVVGKFFAAVRMSAFWQALFMVVIVVQLFLFVSLLGLLDYWLDFRGRLAKRTERFNKEA